MEERAHFGENIGGGFDGFAMKVDKGMDGVAGEAELGAAVEFVMDAEADGRALAD